MHTHAVKYGSFRYRNFSVKFKTNCFSEVVILDNTYQSSQRIYINVTFLSSDIKPSMKLSFLHNHKSELWVFIKRLPLVHGTDWYLRKLFTVYIWWCICVIHETRQWCSSEKNLLICHVITFANMLLRNHKPILYSKTSYARAQLELASI